MEKDAENLLRAMLVRSRGRARKAGFAHTIGLSDLIALWRQQEGCCAVSGIAFSDERVVDAFVTRPFAPSLDRIDSGQGYVLGNIRIVCTIANFALGQWGETIVRRLAHGIVETERKTERLWFAAQRRKLRRAEKAATTLTGEALLQQRRVIAGIKASITKGPARLSGAGIKAWNTISSQSE